MSSGRNAVRENGGAVASRYLYETLPYGRKLEICRYVQTKGIQDALDEFFDKPVSTEREAKSKLIYEWMRQLPHIEKMCETARGRSAHRAREQGSATILVPDAEREIVLWINNMRVEGIPVSSMMLGMKAEEMAKDFDVRAVDFRASWSCQKLFLWRHRLSFRCKTCCGQIQPALTAEVVQSTNRLTNKLMVENGVDIMYNAGQTAVFFECIPKTTIDNIGVKTVWVRSAGKEKERVSLMTLSGSHGGHYTPFVVKMPPSRIPGQQNENEQRHHGFGVQTRKDMHAAEETNSLRIYTNARRWWTTKLSRVFLVYHFGSRANVSFPILLLWDDFAGHWTDAVRACASELNAVLISVPPGYTSVCQPSDTSWNFSLKARIRRQWLSFVSNQFASRFGTIAFRLNAPTRTDIMGWIAHVWAGLPADTIANGFRSIVEQHGEENDDYYALVVKMEQLGLLDRKVGSVGDDDDVLHRELGKSFSVVMECVHFAVSDLVVPVPSCLMVTA